MNDVTTPAMPHVLLVDDEPDTVLTLTIGIELDGLRVSSARNGGQALEMIARDAPDLIFTDLMMPELDGVELVTRLWANPATKGIPVLVMTGRFLDPKMQATLESFANIRGVIQKPFPLKIVISAIRRVLNHRGTGIPRHE